MTQAERWFIVDAPISDAERDAFGHTDVASNLKMMLRSRTHGRLLIGLLGPFGVGKSTVIELLKSDLRHDRTHALVRISAERHENAGLHRSLIYSFAEKLVEEKCITDATAEDLLSELEMSSSMMTVDPTAAPLLIWARKLRHASGRLLINILLWILAIIATAGLLTLVLSLIGVDITQAVWTWITLGAGFTAILAPTLSTLWSVSNGDSWISSWLRPGQSTSTRPRVEAADEFERAFAQLIGRVKQSVVIAIDDIDRLSSDEVLAALNAIRSFQLTCPADKRPTFIVSADEAVIRQAITKAHPGLASSPGEDRAAAKAFLDRLFVQRQLMPPHSRRDLRTYARELLATVDHAGAHALGAELDNTLAVLIHDGVTDPRHVIRLLNAFFGDYRLATQREQHRRTRSITPGEVTAHPRTLAQMTVLKVDFPEFFEKFSEDTEILDLVAEATRDGNTDRLAEHGVPLNTPWYADLSRFVSRTKGFVHPVDDILAFIYLGQDEVDRLAGSRDAREMRRLLVNNQIAGLNQLLSRRNTDPQTRQLDRLVPLIIDTLDTVYDLELANTLGSITHIIDQLPAPERPRIADSFGRALARSTCTDPQLDGLVELATSSTEDELAQSITQYLLSTAIAEDDATTRALTVLAHRSDLAAILGPDTITQFLNERITDLTSADYDTFESWFDAVDASPAPDLHPILSWAVLSGIDATDDDISNSWADKALNVFDPAGPSHREEATQLITKIVGSDDIASQVGRLALLGFSAWNSTDPQELADVAFAIYNGGLADDGTLTRSIRPDAETAAVELMRSAVAHSSAHEFTIGGQEVTVPVAAARFAAAVLESQQGEDPRPPIRQLLIELIQVDSAAGSILASAFVNAWNEDGVIGNASAHTTLGAVVPYLDELDEPTTAAVRDAFVTATAPAATQESVDAYLTTVTAVLSTATGKTWIPTFTESLRSQITYSNTESTQRATLALNAIFTSTDVPDNEASAVLESYRPLYSQSGSQSTAASALTTLRWPVTMWSSVLQLLAQYHSTVSERDYEALARQLCTVNPVPAIPNELAAGLRDAIVKLGRQDQALAGIDHLTLALPFEQAILVATESPGMGHTLVDAVAQQPDQLTAVSLFLRTFLAHPTPESGVEDPGLTALIASHYPSEYTHTVDKEIDGQLAGDTYASHAAWTAVLAPLTGDDAEHLYTGIDRALSGSAGDVENAQELVLASTLVDGHRHRIIPLATAALTQWIRVHKDPHVSATLAASLDLDPEARIAGRAAIATRPRNSEQRQAWEAAMNKLE
ncbi:P-loop NTPase fold protein [Rhodococcus sp. P1Y]|uniref:P-loop NTPase fold protein n=1 Tax=Rhodococcus sp. P1Y TaxID=1302308 RepID=UPI000EAE93E4|nr:P-loop NTPase fold protein [Rhodococcus sp. P1Y]AYJ50541.1 hypothetical protein D8W71_22220 [Rhodococcus sp. P1Y]